MRAEDLDNPWVGKLSDFDKFILYLYFFFYHYKYLYTDSVKNVIEYVKQIYQFLRCIGSLVHIVLPSVDQIE